MPQLMPPLQTPEKDAPVAEPSSAVGTTSNSQLQALLGAGTPPDDPALISALDGTGAEGLLGQLLAGSGAVSSAIDKASAAKLDGASPMLALAAGRLDANAAGGQAEQLARRRLADDLALSHYAGKPVVGAGQAPMPAGLLGPYVGAQLGGVEAAVAAAEGIQAEALRHRAATATDAALAAQTLVGLVDAQGIGARPWLWAVVAGSKASAAVKSELAPYSPTLADQASVAFKKPEAKKREAAPIDDQGWGAWLSDAFGLSSDTQAEPSQKTTAKAGESGSTFGLRTDDGQTQFSGSASAKVTADGVSGGLSGQRKQTVLLHEAEDDWQKSERTRGGSVAWDAKAGASATGEVGSKQTTQYGNQQVTSETSTKAAWDEKKWSVEGSASEEVFEDEVGNKRTTAAKLGQADGQTFGEVSRTRTVQDGKDYADSRQVSVGFKGDEVTGKYATTTEAVNDGIANKATDSRSASFSHDSASVGWGRNVSTTDDTVVRGESYDAKVGLDARGFSARVDTGDTAALGDDYVHERKVGVGANSQGVQVSASDQTQWKDGDQSHSDATSATAQLGADRSSVGLGRRSESSGADGSADLRSASATLDTEGRLTGTLASKRRAPKAADGTSGEETGVTASGMIDFGPDGIEGGSARVSTDFKGGKKLDVGAGYAFHLGEPQPTGLGTWVIEYRQTLQASVGGGLSKGFDSQGGSSMGNVGGSVNASGSAVGSGTRVFSSRESALAFYTNPQLAAFEAPSAQSALHMTPGSTSNQLVSTEVGGNASLKWGIGEASAAASQAASHGLSVTRGEGSMVVVRIEDASKVSGKLGLSAGVGMTRSQSQRDFESIVVLFDLSQPNAAKAYDDFVAGGRLAAGPGVQVTHTNGSTQTDTAGVSLIAGSGSTTAEGTHQQVQTQEGVLDQFIGRFEQNELYNKVLGLFGSESSQTESHQATFSEDDAGHLFVAARSQVEGDDAGRAHGGLARAANLPGQANDIEGQGSGQWTVENVFPDEALSEFIGAVESGDYEPHSGGMLDRTGVDMRRALVEASGDTTAQRAVLHDFVKRGGHDSLTQLQLREYTSGEQLYVQLEGSDVFLGAAKEAVLQQQIAGLDAAVSDPDADWPGLYRKAVPLRAQTLKRSLELRDYSKFKDLPRELRVEQMDRVEETLGALERLVSVIEGNLFLDTGTHPQQQRDQNGDEVGMLRAEMTDARVAMEAAYEQARHAWWVHGGAWSMKDAEGELGAGGLARVMPGNEFGAYAEARECMDKADGLRSRAAGFEVDAAGHNLQDPSRVGLAARSLRDASASYDRARTEYSACSAALVEVEDRHADEPGYWAGRDSNLPRGL